MDRHSLKDWLYRLSAEMHDGPDAHLTDKVTAFADEISKDDNGDAHEAEPVVNPEPFNSMPEEVAVVHEDPKPQPLTDAELETLRALLERAHQ